MTNDLSSSKSVVNDPLFLTKQITTMVDRWPPVIAVGLPRSGSSFLSDIVSQLDDWYMFDDLYLYREAKSIGAIENNLTPSQLDKLLFFLGWQIRARIKFGTYSIPSMTLDDVDKMNDAIKVTFSGKEVRWYELLEEWMLRLAHNEGCTHWGYKAPQDFMCLDMLEKIFPGVSYIYIKRDPRKMMASLKYVNDNDGNPGQYHPVFYSLYWKNASKIMLAHSCEHKVHNVKFEDLISAPRAEADKIAFFLNTNISGEIIVKQANTSFSNHKRKKLSDTEILICEKILGTSLMDYDYKLGKGRFRWIDIPELCFVSIRFLIYQGFRVFRSRSSLVSISSFIRTSLSFSKK
ncbi:MAG: sulfotransferase [Pseudomonadota bacterium]